MFEQGKPHALCVKMSNVDLSEDNDSRLSFDQLSSRTRTLNHNEEECVSNRQSQRSTCDTISSNGGGSESDVYDKAEAIVEYEWPLDSGKFHFIEEYLADYLEIKSMRRTYPSLERRRVHSLDEREFLKSNRFVTELQCDLGVIALPSEQVYQLLSPKYKKKFEAYETIRHQQMYEEMVETVWNSHITRGDSLSVDDLRAQAVKECSSWNTTKPTWKRRTSYFNSNTGVMHKRTLREKASNKVAIPVSRFPVALLPHQFVDSNCIAKRFTPEELKRLPLNTSLSLEPLVEEQSPVDFEISEVEKSNSDDTEEVGEEANDFTRWGASSETVSCCADDDMDSSGSSLFEAIVVKKSKIL